MNLSFQVKKAPQSSGIYIFKNKKGGFLYIGRATNLRRRILQYFQKPIDSRIQEMVSLAHYLKFKKTKSVLEAIILEANLIKKYWPKYNVKDKDDRSFIYIIIPEAEYPRPYIIRGKEIENQSAIWRIKTEKFHLFGPYQSLSLVKNALKIIRRIFPYSTCKPFQGKPCFDYQIGLCPGLCIGAISKKDYQKNIKNLILFLKGERKKLIEKLKKENPDKIKALEHIQDVALISNESEIENWSASRRMKIKNLAKRIEGYDISHLSGKETYGSMAVFINNKPDTSQYRLFKIKDGKVSDDLAALKEMIVRRFKHKEWQYPDLILVDGGRPQVNYIEKALEELSVNITLIGISKYAGDALIFAKSVKKSEKEIIKLSKNILLQLRDEAHRFALKSSRLSREKWQD